MPVELWDDKTANLIDDFDDEAEALQLVRETIALHGRKAIATWALDRLEPGAPLIRGDELYRLADGVTLHG